MRRITKTIRELCKDKGVSVCKMESDCDFGNGIVGTWEQGHMPTAEKVAVLANYFGLSCDDIIKSLMGYEH